MREDDPRPVSASLDAMATWLVRVETREVSKAAATLLGCAVERFISGRKADPDRAHMALLDLERLAARTPTRDVAVSWRDLVSSSDEGFGHHLFRLARRGPAHRRKTGAPSSR